MIMYNINIIIWHHPLLRSIHTPLYFTTTRYRKRERRGSNRVLHAAEICIRGDGRCRSWSTVDHRCIHHHLHHTVITIICICTCDHHLYHLQLYMRS